MITTILNENRLERYGWLFSPSLGLMVSEHECGGGRWDVELQSYRRIERRSEQPAWDWSDETFDGADTLADLVRTVPELATVQDWVPGDTVHFL